jgi:hypothetical protein
LIGLVAILLLRQLITPDSEHALSLNLGVPVGAASDVSAAEQAPLSTQGRIVSMRERSELIARAQVWREPYTPVARARLGTNAGTPDTLECRFRLAALAGTTSKFDCMLASGQEVRVTHGLDAEGPSQAAASRLATVLGFGADAVGLVERLNCLGCPGEPFVVSRATDFFDGGARDHRALNDEGSREFDWVAVEQKLNARPIESDGRRGWAFFELDAVNPSKGGAPRAHVDALRLLAVFLAHWDNAAENQRLVCVSESWAEGSTCAAPFLVLQDLGSTFGPSRVDVRAWEQAPIWDDRAACRLAMDDLPNGGGTFGPIRVSERGRRFLAKLLDQLTDAQLSELFTWARFERPRPSVDQETPVSEWVRVFKARRQAITDGPSCPDA